MNLEKINRHKNQFFSGIMEIKNLWVQVLRSDILKIKVIALLVKTFVEKSYQQIYTTSPSFTVWKHI